MILGMLLMGFFVMALLPPRWQFFLTVAIAGGLLWVSTFFIPEIKDTGTLTYWQLIPSAFGIGAANAAVGAAAGWITGWAVRWVFSKIFVAVRSRRVRISG
ncbi:hypothetical protein [Demequina pelophila]|uniref:hypothetical protein n=1 Tax=Demequina pelophila TaxID=1638984 RepID=UPI0007860DF4|nr:hypothetical protein [Demequina pelophila]